MSILIKHSTILTQNDSRQQLQGDLYIEDHQIVELSKNRFLLRLIIKSMEQRNSFYLV